MIGLFLINSLNIFWITRLKQKWPRISECRLCSRGSLQGAEWRSPARRGFCLRWGCRDQDSVVSLVIPCVLDTGDTPPSELNSFCYNGSQNNEDFNYLMFLFCCQFGGICHLVLSFFMLYLCWSPYHGLLRWVIHQKMLFWHTDNPVDRRWEGSVPSAPHTPAVYLVLPWTPGLRPE